MAKTVTLIEGFGEDMPKEVSITQGTTVRAFKEKVAKRLGVSPANMQLSTNDEKLLDEGADLYKAVADGDRLYAEPRAKGG